MFSYICPQAWFVNFVQLHICYCSNDCWSTGWFTSSCFGIFVPRRFPESSFEMLYNDMIYLRTKDAQKQKAWNQSSKSFRTEIVMIHSCFPSFLWCWVLRLIICYVLIFITYNVRPLVEKNLKSPDVTCLSTSAPYEFLRSVKRILKW